jgi:glycosyltransferase involved in cell wall biosynthesis
MRSRRRLLYIQFTNPAGYPPLQHSSRMAAEAGWEVLFLGTGALGANALRFPPHACIRERRLPSMSMGEPAWLRYLLFALWVLGWVLLWRPSRIYASDYLTCPIALLLTFVPGVKVIYHEHDAPAPAAGRAARQICLAARKRLARRAARCVLPNRQRVARFVHEVRTVGSIACVWHCPAREEVGPARPAGDNQTLWVLYHGSIVPSRLPPTIVPALARLPDGVRLRVIGYETVGHNGYVRDLQATARQLGVEDRIEFLGAMSRPDVFAWARRSDVGLSFTPDDLAMVGASNKPFDYLASGTPLLVSDLEDWRCLYVAAGYGLACNPDDPESIAAALRWFLTHPGERRDMGERGRQRIEAEWNYERQFAPVLADLVAC